MKDGRIGLLWVTIPKLVTDEGVLKSRTAKTIHLKHFCMAFAGSLLTLWGRYQFHERTPRFQGATEG